MSINIVNNLVLEAQSELQRSKDIRDEAIRAYQRHLVLIEAGIVGHFTASKENDLEFLASNIKVAKRDFLVKKKSLETVATLQTKVASSKVYAARLRDKLDAANSIDF